MLVARCCAVARRRRRAAPIRGAASIAQLPPTNDRRRPPRGGRPLPHRAPHRRLAQFAHPAGRSRMPIALHGLALRKASDAISPLNAVVEPGCCRTPPAAAAASALAATARAPAKARKVAFARSASRAAPVTSSTVCGAGTPQARRDGREPEVITLCGALVAKLDISWNQICEYTRSPGILDCWHRLFIDGTLKGTTESTC